MSIVNTQETQKKKKGKKKGFKRYDEQSQIAQETCTLCIKKDKLNMHYLLLTTFTTETKVINPS